MNTFYVSYDIKGIQKSIFAVPRLLSIIGGSALIDRYDKDTIDEIVASTGGTERIFSGGGKGIISCQSKDSAEIVVKSLVSEAHSVGLSLRAGISETLEMAMLEGKDLYPFIPENLEGHPCEESGLYPVKQKGTHPIVKQRIDYAREDRVGTYIIDLMKKMNVLPPKLRGSKLGFVRSIDHSDREFGLAGSKLFSERNRWAVIAMDGNDLGQQFRSCELAGDEKRIWARKVSDTISACTEKAFANSLGDVLEDLLKEVELPTYQDKGEEVTLLPFRPLILGGDDVLLISHTSVAMLFARKMIQNFEDFTAMAEDQNTGAPLWPAPNQGGKLRISAGIVYIGTTYPLHKAIDYADSLLGGAKASNRKKDWPTPSMIDWESITESFIDSPAERRYRELVFQDNDLNGDRIELTCRPYTLEDLVYKLIPLMDKIRCESSRSTTVSLLENMKKSWAERVLYFSSYNRHSENRWIADLLDETDPDNPATGWIREVSGIRKTLIPDALLLIEEEHRRTAGGGR